MPRYKNTSGKVYISRLLGKVIEPNEEVETNFELPPTETAFLEKIDDAPIGDKDYYEQITIPANSSKTIEFDPLRYVKILVLLSADNPQLQQPLRLIENYLNDDTSRVNYIDRYRGYEYNNYRYRKSNITSFTIFNDNPFDVKVDVYWSIGWD